MIMKRTLSAIIVGCSLLAVPATAQEIAKTGSMAVPMPLNMEHAGDAIHNYSLGAGLRYTFKSQGNFTMALGAQHEWRNTRLDYGKVGEQNLYADVSRRAFQFQVLGIYKLVECKSTFGAEFSALLGADLSLPYSKDVQYMASATSEPAQMVRLENRTGYGLTFGLHTRLDETIAYVTEQVKAGNLYVNRNIIGAVVGLQPFGGRGLSGTGPKAGGPLYIGRLVQRAPVPPHHSSVQVDSALRDFASWLGGRGHNGEAEAARELGGASALGLVKELPGQWASAMFMRCIRADAFCSRR